MHSIIEPGSSIAFIGPRSIEIQKSARCWIVLLWGLLVFPNSSSVVARENPPATPAKVTGTLTGRFIFDDQLPERLDSAPWLSRIDLDSGLHRDTTGRVSGMELCYRELLQLGIRADTRDASLLIGPRGGLANVLVWCTSLEIPWTKPKGVELPPVSIRVKNGNFEPRMTILGVGQTLLLENHDPCWFNVHLMPHRNNEINMILKANSIDTPVRWTPALPEKLPFQYRSEQQAWAKGWVFVHGNPFAAISQADGSFVIPNLPEGEWEFRVWHERCGYVNFWPKGQFKHRIQAGMNDLGTVNVKPDLPRGLHLEPVSEIPEIANPQQSERVIPVPDARRVAVQDQTQSAPMARVIHHWSVILVDGVTDVPIPGVEVRVKGGKAGVHDPQLMTLKSDVNGLIAIPLHEGTGTTLQVRSADWFTGNWVAVGYFGQIEKSHDKAQGKPETVNPVEPRRVKLWKGTRVTGKLLTPDGKPAPGIRMNVGVSVSNWDWRQRLGLDLNRSSFDRIKWPNWTDTVLTGTDGTFAIAVPPTGARSWVRLGTTSLGLGPVNSVVLDRDGPDNALFHYAPFETEIGVSKAPTARGEVEQLDFGALTLQRGRILSGKVVDSAGRPLAGVHLITSNGNPPYTDRRCVSDQEGHFEFLPLNSGSCTLTIDARLRNAQGEVYSRDVQAVFLPRTVTLPPKYGRQEIIARAEPHLTLEFDWQDRRARRGPVSYYGTYLVSGEIPSETSIPGRWSGETETIDRDGRRFLHIKVPASLTNARLTLPADSVVTASYKDDQTQSGPGQVELGNLKINRHRIIYGDEPIPSK